MLRRTIVKKIIFMLPVLASAAGFQILEQNVTYLGQSYSGTASSLDNATATFYNPAGIVFTKGWQFSYSNAFILPQTKYTLSAPVSVFNGSSRVDIGSSGVEEDADNRLIPIPQLFMTKDFGSKLAFGFSVNSPFGLSTAYDKSSSLAYAAQKSSLQTINFSPNFAYKVTDSLSVAVGADYSLGRLILSKKSASLSGVLVENKLNGDGLGWHLGAFYRANQYDLGFRFHSTIEYKMDGDVYPTTLGDKVSTTLNSPEFYVASLNYHVSDKGDILFDAQFTNWDRIDTIVLDYTGGILASALTASEPLRTMREFFDSSWRFALGYKQQFSDAMTIRFGVAYDQTPVIDEERGPALPDGNRTWVSLGLSSKIGSSTFDLGYAFINMQDQTLNYRSVPASDATFAGASTNVQGSWHTHVHLFGLQWNAEWK